MMIDKIKALYLKYVVRYQDPRRYWDVRWSLGPDPSTKEDEKDLMSIGLWMQKFSCQSILEIGCGLGSLRRLPGYLGLDFSKEALEQSGLQEYVYADITQLLPFPNDSWDALLSRYVLLHIKPKKISRVISEICRVTKTIIFLREPRDFLETQPHCFAHDLQTLFAEAGWQGPVVVLFQ